jgi:hypothetical protein
MVQRACVRACDICTQIRVSSYKTQNHTEDKELETMAIKAKLSLGITPKMKDLSCHPQNRSLDACLVPRVGWKLSLLYEVLRILVLFRGQLINYETPDPEC